MKKYLLLLILSLTSCVALHAQDLLWAKQFQGQGSYRTNATTVAQSGAIYSVGRLFGTVDFDPGASVHNVSSTYAMAICKMDNDGDFLWVKHIDIAYDLYPYEIAVDDSDNVIIVGIFEDTMDFDPGPGVHMLAANWYAPDVFILKLDSSGNFKWAHSLSKYGDDYALSTTIDNAGCIYLTGQMQAGLSYMDTVDFDPGPGVHNLYGLNYMYILKLDNAGNFVWVKQWGDVSGSVGVTWVEGRAVKVDDAGHLYATGSFETFDPIDMDPGPGTYMIETSGVFTIKLDTAGNFKWVKLLQSLGLSTKRSTDVFVDKNYNVYTSGYFQDTIDFDPGPNVYNLYGGPAGFVQKLDSAGNFVWAKQILGTGTIEVLSIQVDEYQNVYSFGHFFSTADFDPGPGTYYMSPDSVSLDCFLQKLDSTGNLVWAGKFNGIGFFNRFDLDADNNIYIANYFYDSVDVDITSNIHMLVDDSIGDGYIMKLSTCSSSFQVFAASASPTSCPGNDGSIIFSGLNSAFTYGLSYYLNGQLMTTSISDTGNGFLLDSLSFGLYDDITVLIGACPSNVLGPISLIAPCDSVWPGDVNYDMVADNNDALDLLLVLGDVGTSRSNASINWNAEYSSDWNTVQYNTINTMHADCNGDGQISLADTIAVSANYGLTHLKGTHSQAKPIPGLPDLYFDFENSVFTAGIPLTIPIKFGSDDMAVKDILGIAANIRIEGAVAEEISLQVTNTWLGEQQQMINYTKVVDDTRLDWVVGRTDRSNISGSGEIGSLRLMLPADAAHKTIRVYFDNVRVIDNGGREFSEFNVVDLKVNVQPMDKTTVIYPNPSSGFMNIASRDDLDHVVVTDVRGQVIINKVLSGKSGSVHLEMPGLYFVSVYSAGSVTTEKILIAK